MTDRDRTETKERRAETAEAPATPVEREEAVEALALVLSEAVWNYSWPLCPYSLVRCGGGAGRVLPRERQHLKAEPDRVRFPKVDMR